jgi:hypothetical protein
MTGRQGGVEVPSATSEVRVEIPKVGIMPTPRWQFHGAFCCEGGSWLLRRGHGRIWEGNFVGTLRCFSGARRLEPQAIQVPSPITYYGC